MLTVIGLLSMAKHLWFSSDMRRDDTWRSLGLVQYAAHPRQGMMSVVAAPLVIVMTALMVGSP